MILGTPHVSLELGIPDWLTAVIILGIIVIYIGLKKRIKTIRQRKTAMEAGEDEDTKE